MGDATKKRVISIDDSASTRAVIKNFLTDSNYELVASLKDGVEGARVYTEMKPDLVLLDIVMPIQSGKDTLRQILAGDSSARVVMVSSLGTEEAVHECLQAGARSFLQKPFAKDDLLNTLKTVLETAEAGAK